MIVWKTNRITIYEKDFERIEKELEYRVEELEYVITYVKQLKKAKNEISENEINMLQVLICNVIHNCFGCPINLECEIRFKECSNEVSNSCSFCPRLSICVWEGKVRGYEKEGLG
jgi:radical SAM superfamily enzyme with C-terminal helix-hairpin-helix motif